MHLILIPDNGGFLVLEEDDWIGNAQPGRARITPEDFFLLISAAKEGNLDQVLAITDEMVARAIERLPFYDSDALEDGVRLMLEYALNIPQHASEPDTGESDGPNEEEAVVSRS